ncbi:IS110 family transposase [Mycobacterium marinum]|uniref:IS110 family transposase n=1 Tax=Mycobacterium marinum TaxID=1781 RepID=UPI003563F3E1
MLTDKVEFVIGVDAHRDSHTAAVVTAAGGIVDRLTVATDAFGFRKLDAFVAAHATGRRVWAIEGTGSFGAGLTTHLLERGEWVVKIDRPARPARRDGAKSDDLDAVRAAREALTREHLAAPRARGDREAMRVLLTAREGVITARTKAIGQLKAMIVNAPQSLRDQLRRGTTDEQLNRCARLRTLPSHSVEHRATVRAIRATARRALILEAEAAEHETELELLVTVACPQLLDRPGIGVITAAQFLISWSHRDRVRHEAAFAALAGAAPIPARSGATVRHRLNRAGDRQLKPRLTHRCTHPPTVRAHHQGLRCPTHRPRQDTPRGQTLPQTSHRPRGLPHHANTRRVDHHHQIGGLTDIEASLSPRWPS